MFKHNTAWYNPQTMDINRISKDILVILKMVEFFSLKHGEILQHKFFICFNLNGRTSFKYISSKIEICHKIISCIEHHW